VWFRMSEGSWFRVTIKNLGRESHPTLGGVLLQSFQRLTLTSINCSRGSVASFSEAFSDISHRSVQNPLVKSMLVS